MSAVTLAQQATGSIEGLVRDATGAVLAGADVAVINTETGAVRMFQTNESGFYKVPSLPSGKYTVRVTVQGFAPKELTSVVLQVGSIAEVNVDLEVGNAGGEVVTVTAEAPLVETTRTYVATTVDERSIKDLPVNGRNFLEFALLTPGVSADPRGGDISFGGLRGTNNSLQIDGSDNNNTFFGQSLGRTGSGRAPYQFSKDAVKEFQVNTNTYAAEYGRAGGAVINAVTKSGTNEFHGGAFIFFRDRSLNAEEPFAKANRRLKARNRFYQFGAIASGPIKKDKAFFFFNYDGQRNTEPNPVFFGAPVPNDPVSQAVAQSLTRFLAPYDREFKQDVFLGKVDLQLTDKNRLTVRYNHQEFTGTNLESSGNQSSFEHTGNSNVMSDTLTANLTTVLTPRLVNDARFQFARDDEPGESNAPDTPEAVIRSGTVTFLTIGRNNFSPRFTNIKKYQFLDSVAYTAGTHSIKFGVDVNIERIENFFPGLFSGVYNFTSLADFADGRPSGGYNQAFAGAGTDGPLSRPNKSEFSAYIQDDWRATERLKIYYGVRYDYERLEEPSIRNPNFQLAQSRIDTGQLNQDLNNFGPRVGFSYAATKDNKTVVRAGYGVFYSRTPSILTGTVITNNGIQIQNFTFTGNNTPIFPNKFNAPPAGAAAGRPNIFFYDRNFVSPLIQQGSLGIERELPGKISVSLSYLVVKGTHLQRVRDINLAPPTPTSIAVGIPGTPRLTFDRFSSPRPFSSFNRVTMVASDSNSVYHGLALQVNKRYSQNFQFLFSYTFSKAIDDKPEATSVVVGNAGDDAKQVSNYFRPDLDRGLGESDVKHRAIVSGVYDLNFSKYVGSDTGIAKAIFDGYSLSGIFTATSGRPFSATVPIDLNNDGNSRTDRVPGVGRNTLRGPNFYQLDMRLSKSFRPTETTKIEFIGEAFNLLNRTNIANIDTNRFNISGTAPNQILVPNRNFMNGISSTGAPRGANRQFQLALKFDF
jgi:hypothetical protein